MSSKNLIPQYQSAKTCGQCGKAFTLVSLHKHSCSACGLAYCRNCSNHFLILAAADLQPPVTMENIKLPTKPQRCCDPCFTRIASRKKNGAVPIQNNVRSKYHFGRKLGEGGFAEVFEATSAVGNTKVAIKVIKKDKMEEDDVAAIHQEVRVLESLNHPNIVHLFEFFDEPRNYYMVMEVISGGELFDRIVEMTVYNEKEARDLVVVLLQALKYMHDRNIVHRDLKPENLLLTSKSDNADIKVVDFGFAIECDGFNITQQVGTPGYIAPEILLKHAYGKPVDMWSFGVILYILLGGYPPFHDDNQSKLFAKIKKGEFVFHPEYWGGVSEEAMDMIRRLLDVNMTTRMTVDQALAHPWVQADVALLMSKNLDSNLVALRKYQKTKKWRAAGNAIMMINRMRRLTSASSPRSTDGSASKGPAVPHLLSERFELHEKLGEGGYAVVKRGVSKLDNSQVAIKILHRSKMDKHHEDGMRNEVQIMMALSHPNVVKAMDIFEEPEHFYVVMELITGGELFDRIVGKQFYKELEARNLAKTLLLAIKYIHDNNYVHRDLKPENLLLVSPENDFDVKIVDFGFATEVNGENLTTHCGTPGYIAPEILQDKPYGKSVDMWAFGVILYILLGGYPPFYDKNQQMLFRKILKGAYTFHPEYWGQVSDEAKDLIRRILVVDVSQRVTVDQALAHPWFHHDEDALDGRVLTMGLAELRKFQARRKLRAGIRAIISINRMRLFASKSNENMKKKFESASHDDDAYDVEVSAAESVQKEGI